MVDEQKQTYLVTIFLFLKSFHCPQLFYCCPCLTTAPASLYAWYVNKLRQNVRLQT